MNITWLLNENLKVTMERDKKFTEACKEMEYGEILPPNYKLVYILHNGFYKKICTIESHNLNLFISNHRVPKDYIFIVWDGNEFNIGEKEDFLKNTTGVNPLLDSLKLTVLDKKHYQWMKYNDPKALQQIIKAIQDVEPTFNIQDNK